MRDELVVKISNQSNKIKKVSNHKRTKGYNYIF